MTSYAFPKTKKKCSTNKFAAKKSLIVAVFTAPLTITYCATSVDPLTAHESHALFSRISVLRCELYYRSFAFP
jgi:hypothetical protein